MLSTIPAKCKAGTVDPTFDQDAVSNAPISRSSKRHKIVADIDVMEDAGKSMCGNGKGVILTSVGTTPCAESDGR